MKSAIFAVVLLTLGLLSLPVLAQQQDLQDVMNAGNALSARESELLGKKDAAGIASLFTSDGLLVMLAPQFAFKPGRDAIQKHYQGIIDAGATSITLEFKNMELPDQIVGPSFGVLACLKDCRRRHYTGTDKPRFRDALEDRHDLEAGQNPVLKTKSVFHVEPLARSQKAEPAIWLQESCRVRPEITMKIAASR